MQLEAGELNNVLTAFHSRISQILEYEGDLFRSERIEGGTFVDFHFAIMEVEAWFLGMPEFLGKLDERLTPEYVQQNVGLNHDDDPEKTVFHPAVKVGEIYALVGKHYDKHQSDISAIMARLTTEDYLHLIGSGKCPTFKSFAESLLGTTFGNSCP